MKNATHEEILVPNENTSPEIIAERQHLQSVMDKLIGDTVTPTLQGGAPVTAPKLTPAERKARRQKRQAAKAAVAN